MNQATSDARAAHAADTPGRAARVLVIRIGRLGDSVMATTVIEPLQARFGRDVVIDYACGPGASAEILRLDPRINRVFPITRRRLHWCLNPLKAVLRAHSRMHPYDLVLNLECGRECDDFVRFLRYQEFQGRPRTVARQVADRHCVDTEKEIYRDLLGDELTDAATPSIRTADGPLPAMLEGCGRYVLLNPGFSGMDRTDYRAHRGWPMEHWENLVGCITAKTGWSVAVNGAAAEQSMLQPLLGLSGVRSLLGCDLRQLLTAVRGALCVVSVDTGTMHLAAAAGTPVLALFGPTRPAVTGPYPGDAPSRVLTTQIGCRPCVGTPMQRQCRANRCMTGLSPADVFAAMLNLTGVDGVKAPLQVAE
ncbi:MAG: glycosyltransferase family 9 protein [Lysobacterales bacterium]|jgi:ADP-heptose:LPS heptosyltransferase